MLNLEKKIIQYWRSRKKKIKNKKEKEWTNYLKEIEIEDCNDKKVWGVWDLALACVLCIIFNKETKPNPQLNISKLWKH